MYEQRTLAAIFLRDYEWSLPEHSIHEGSLKNAFSPFALTLPHDLELTFRRIPEGERKLLGVPKGE